MRGFTEAFSRNQPEPSEARVVHRNIKNSRSIDASRTDSKHPDSRGQPPLERGCHPSKMRVIKRDMGELVGVAVKKGKQSRMSAPSMIMPVRASEITASVELQDLAFAGFAITASGHRRSGEQQAACGATSHPRSGCN